MKGVIMIVAILVVDLVLYLRERRRRIEAEILLGKALSDFLSNGSIKDLIVIQKMYEEMMEPVNRLRNIEE